VLSRKTVRDDPEGEHRRGGRVGVTRRPEPRGLLQLAEKLLEAVVLEELAHRDALEAGGDVDLDAAGPVDVDQGAAPLDERQAVVLSAAGMGLDQLQLGVPAHEQAGQPPGLGQQEAAGRHFRSITT
jgi:hypothetical protein